MHERIQNILIDILTISVIDGHTLPGDNNVNTVTFNALYSVQNSFTISLLYNQNFMLLCIIPFMKL